MSNFRVNTIVPDSINNPTGTISLPGSLSVTSFTSTSVLDATTPSAASITALGGLGIAKSLALGGNVIFSGSSTTSNIIRNTTAGSDDKGLILSATNTTSSTRGASLELYGNQLNSGTARLITGSAGSFIVQAGATDTARFAGTGVVTLYGTTSSTSSTVGTLVLANGGLSISNTTDATSATSGGSLTLGGGLAVGGSIFIGGTLSSSGGLTNSAFVRVTATTEATGDGIGALVSLGGAAVSKNMYIGGNTTIIGTASVGGPLTVTTTSDTSISTFGGMSIGKGVIVTGQLSASSNVSITGVLQTINTTDSTATTNGSATFAGGVGVASTLRVGGSVFSAGNLTLSNTTGILSFAGSITGTSTTDSTALGSGAITTAGGLSVGKIARIGGNLFVSGTTGLTGALTLTSATASGVVSITNATATTSATTGALVVTGGVGITSAIFAAGKATFSDATDSTSITTGGTIVSGGLGVSKAVFLGTTLNVAGIATLGSISTGAISSSGVITSTNATNSTSVGTGSAIFSGGVSVALNTNVGGNLSITGTSTFTGNQIASGIVNITNTTDSSTLTAASLVTAGGASVGKTLRVGENAVITGGITVSGATVSLNTTVSTNSASGAFVVSGGVGVGGALNVADTLGVTGLATFSAATSTSGIASFLNVTDSTSLGSGSIVTAGGIGVAKQLRVGTSLTVAGNTNVVALNASGVVTFSNATEATAFNAAAVKISGGLGVALKTILNSTLTVAGSTSLVGALSVSNVTDSSTTATGCATFAGGVGVTMNLNVGGGLSVGAASTFTGVLTNTAGSLNLNSVNISDASSTLLIRSALPGIRVASTDALKTTQYVNSIDLFSLGNSYVDANHEALQVTTTSTNTYSIITRNAGSGVLRRLVLQAGGANTGQLTLNTSGTVSIGTGTTDSTSPLDGSVMISGGIGVPGSVSIGNSLRIFGATSGAVSWAAPSTVTSYNLTLPPSLPVAGNYALVSSTTGVLSWSEMTTSNPTFGTVNVTGTGAGSITTAGGITAGGMTLSTTSGVTTNTPILNILGNGGANNMVGIDLSPFSGRTGGNSVRLLAFDAGTFDAYFSLRVATGSSATVATEILRATQQFVSIQAATAATSTTTGALRVAGGVGIVGATFAGANINLSGVTAGSNQIICTTTAAATLGVPTLTTRSAGSRLVMYPSLSGTNVDYAIGIEGAHIWFSVGNSTEGFKWYSGTTNSMTLRNVGTAGALTLNSGLRLQFGGSTSGSVTIGSPATITSYTLTLPSSLPSANNFALVSSTSGVLTWSEMTTANPTFTSVMITGTTPSTSVGTGAIIVSGGGSFSSGLSIGGTLYLKGATSGTIALKAPDTNSSPVYTLPPDLPLSGQVLTGSAEGVLSWTNMSSSSNFQALGENNVSTPTEITNMKFTGVFKFDVLVDVTTSTGRQTAMYTLRGFPNASGYALFENYAGDDVGYDFTIDETGQLYYTSPNTVNWTGATIKWTGAQTYSSVAGGSPTGAVGANNVSSPEDVTDLVMTGPQFCNYVLVSINATTSTTTLYRLEGVQQPSGAWQLSQAGTGPNQGIIFSITAAGQVQYTSPNTAGWISTAFQFYPQETTLQNSASFAKISVTGTEDTTDLSTGALQVTGGMSVDKAFIRAFSYNPTVTYITTGTPAVVAGWQTIPVSIFTQATWLPYVAGVTYVGDLVTVPFSGLWSINYSGQINNTGLQLRIIVNNSGIGNGQSTAITNNTNNASNILLQSDFTSGAQGGTNGVVALNGGTQLQILLFSTNATTLTFAQLSVTLVQRLG